MRLFRSLLSLTCTLFVASVLAQDSADVPKQKLDYQVTRFMYALNAAKLHMHCRVMSLVSGRLSSTGESLVSRAKVPSPHARCSLYSHRLAYVR